MNHKIKTKRDELAEEYDFSHLSEMQSYRDGFDAASALYEPMIEELNEKLTWLTMHAHLCAAISKAKAAEILGIPLINLDQHWANHMKFTYAKDCLANRCWHLRRD